MTVVMGLSQLCQLSGRLQLRLALHSSLILGPLLIKFAHIRGSRSVEDPLIKLCYSYMLLLSIFFIFCHPC
jgi:hypothetical protein